MAIVPWEPFKDLDKFFEGEDFLPLVPTKWQKFPRINIENKKDEIVAEIETPGINPKDIDISIENNVLQIKGHSESKTEEKKKNYIRQEFSKGYFERAVSLPSEVKGDKTKASYKNGILTITMPKSAKAKEKKIEVKIEK